MKPVKKGLFADVNLREVRELVSELRSGDGIDPREEAKRQRRERRKDRPGQGHGVHKQEQLVSQVQDAIQTALQAAASPILNLLTVQEVAQHGGSLVVAVTLPESSESVDLPEATTALEYAAPMLRREVAGAITRKNAPNLSFVVLPAGAQKVDE
jgi:ribosome-binding factor A